MIRRNDPPLRDEDSVERHAWPEDMEEYGRLFKHRTRQQRRVERHDAVHGQQRPSIWAMKEDG